MQSIDCHPGSMSLKKWGSEAEQAGQLMTCGCSCACVWTPRPRWSLQCKIWSPLQTICPSSSIGSARKHKFDHCLCIWVSELTGVATIRLMQLQSSLLLLIQVSCKSNAAGLQSLQIAQSKLSWGALACQANSTCT